ncbi:hypothetical protein Pla123a_10020 [Posidoniimonas polymericola]|uniref:Uncharacterized protein n=1 Tax=Posidoniimonas polymericola TaxID=2528002 RepID=A0A5C5YT86_9BACT|nr:hypothetical protein [Posidoniimonas polymericola]TWT78212.1 hypothetical protein Pla123a_10020 [Posidoniimonas polymericola]
MSEPAAFAVIKDGKPRYFADRWAAALLRRELLWGPDDFAAWVEQFEELDEWGGDCSGGVAVDLDRRALCWTRDPDASAVPHVRRTYERLLSAAWPGYKLTPAADSLALAKGFGLMVDAEDQPDHADDEYKARPESVEEAAREDDDDDDQDDDGAPAAWITVLDKSGAARHRRLDELSLDLLRGESAAFRAALKLKPAEIPREASVAEGLFVNVDDRTAFVWGSPELLATMTRLGKQWKGWTLRWTKRGYAHQCEASGVAGRPMSDVDALAKILPLALSTEQFNMGAVIGLIGGGVQRYARKATGCLVVVLCVPLALFGVFSGNWTAVGYAAVGTIVVVVGGYKLLSWRVRRAFRKKVTLGGGDEPTTVVAGPLDQLTRKQRVDALLAAAGLPALAEVEPHFPDATGLELLAQG